MSEPLDPVVQWCYDLNAVETVLMRTCETDDERAAVKRVLGIDSQERRATEAYTPDRPPLPEFRPQVDHLAVARSALNRYAAWVDSHPDDDPAPLRTRERALKRAREAVQRLEGDTP